MNTTQDQGVVRRTGGVLGIEGILRAGAGWVMLVLGLWVPAAWGTRMLPLSLEQLAASATLVVHAKVMALESTSDAEGRIFTRVELQTLSVWKGALSESVCRVVMGGGVLGDRSVSVSGQADYTVGEEVVAFLVRNPAGEWVTVGLSQGRFAVRREAGSGRAWVSNGFWGNPPARGAARLAGLPALAPLSLEELKRRTREVHP